MPNVSRRNTFRLLGSLALTPAALRGAMAQEKVLTIGMSFPLTGSLALQAGVARDAAIYAVDETNQKGGVAGYKLQTLVLDDASTTTGQYDPAIAATNARKMLQDASVIAAVGPLNSGSAKAVTPISAREAWRRSAAVRPTPTSMIRSSLRSTGPRVCRSFSAL